MLRGYRKENNLPPKKRLKSQRFNGSHIIAQADELKHFIIVGNTGSGKSLFVQMQLTVLPNFRPHNKGVIVDAKQNLIKILKANGISTFIMNCLDRRHCSLDLSSLIKTELEASEFSFVIVPLHEGDNAYFYDSARDILKGVIVSILQTELPLTLRLIVLVARDPSLAEKVIKAYHPRSHEYEPYFQNKENIYSTLQTKLQDYIFIAAHWEYAQGTIDLQKWASSGDGTIVLGIDYNFPQLSKALNNLLTHFLFQTFQSLPDSRPLAKVP